MPIEPPNDAMVYAQRNMPYVVQDASYPTQLNQSEEEQFRSWLIQNNSNGPIKYFDLDNPYSDYDMRGYWTDNRGTVGGSVDKYDNQLHFPDTYKTPYHETFSRESKYATPDAPYWDKSGQLLDKTGTVLFKPRNK